MKIRFEQLLISSTTLLLMQCVMTQLISTSKPFTLERGLTCLEG
ncbi:hypothetical protein PJ15_0905 [Acinetobacter sp. neg1]|nr:hypothetical protein [Acinetobacter sp. neg1]KHF77849.1 hypothetical protein PJ15_0905 [Acinetobacter sp. neg1]